jgi:hypothetical protein
VKAKWIVSWWDDSVDRQAKRGFDDYEKAITFKFRVENRYNVRAEVKLRERR